MSEFLSGLLSHRIAGAWWVVLLGTLCLPAAGQLRLVTPEEAALPTAPIATTRAITRGPGVKLVSPPEVLGSGFLFRVQFERRGGTKINMDTVRVEYLKEPVIDLTERVKPSLRAELLEVPVAALPVGEHHFRISVKDVDGRLGFGLVSLRAR